VTPESFQHELNTRSLLGPQLRLIRSLDKPRWRIEQKVARAIDYPADDDRARMLSQGYRLVLDTPDGDVSRCPRCFALLSLPVFEYQEFDCPRCKQQGVKKSLKAGYFPLVDRTLIFLERISPKRGFAAYQEMDYQNRLLERGRERDADNVAESLALDYWNRVAEIPQFGYNSKVGTPNRYGAD